MRTTKYILHIQDGEKMEIYHPDKETAKKKGIDLLKEYEGSKLEMVEQCYIDTEGREYNITMGIPTYISDVL